MTNRSRREAIQNLAVLSGAALLGGGAAGGALLAGCSSGSENTSPSGGAGANSGAGAGAGAGDVDVIVLGAGMSGLTVANAAKTAGLSVMVLEARERLGGRLWTADIGGTPVDLGGAWIHGAEGNPIACLAAENGLTSESAGALDTISSAFGAGENRFLTPEQFVGMGAIGEEFLGSLEQLRAELGAGASLSDATAAYIAAAGLEGPNRLYADFAINQGIGELDYAAPATLQSLAYIDEEEGFDGDEEIIRGGYVELIDKIADPLDDSEMRLGEVVERVEYFNDSVSVVTNQGAYTGSNVVVTVPLGVLKAGSIEFSPPLPEQKMTAISRLDMANLEKVVLRFEETFWHESGQESMLYISETYGEMPLFWDLSRYTDSPILVVLYGGQYSRETADERDGAAEVALGALSEILDTSVTDPVEVVTTEWTSDPLSLGSYSYIPVGSSFADMDALAEPVGRLQFAGEATEANYYGTVHGAYLSGVREARRLLGVDQVELSSGPAPAPGCDL